MLQPTQLCIGLAEMWNRKKEFAIQTTEQRLRYLLKKPVPLIRNKNDQFWMIDRHHRLRALIELDKDSQAYGYEVATIDSFKEMDVLNFLEQQGWLYLFDRRGTGPKSPNKLPSSLLQMEDDPYRSLVWKLKKEGYLIVQAQIPFIEFYWAAWLRTRPLPPFNSKHLEPALSVARALVTSQSKSYLK